MLRTSENRMIHIKAVGAVLLCSIAVACGQEGLCNRTRQCSFPDIDQAIQRLSRALQHETISHTAATGASVFHSFITWLSTAYEVVWHRLRVEQVGAVPAPPQDRAYGICAACGNWVFCCMSRVWSPGVTALCQQRYLKGRLHDSPQMSSVHTV